MKKIPIRQIAVTHQEASSSGRFTVRRVKDLVGAGGLKHDLHRHDFFFLLALQKGSGSHEVDFTNYKIVDNSVFFLRPGQVHQLELKEGSTGYLVEFNNEFYFLRSMQAALPKYSVIILNKSCTITSLSCRTSYC